MSNGITIPHDDQLIDEKTAAQIMGLSPRFFQSRRLEGAGPPFIRLSQRCIRYRWRDLKTKYETFRTSGTKTTVRPTLSGEGTAGACDVKA
jgi:hypothetical protein